MLHVFHGKTAPKRGHLDAYNLLSQAYLSTYGGPLPEIYRTERGKPYFVDSPVHFSISHTDHHVFVVLAEENIAVDAEELTRVVNPKLAKKVLSSSEYEQYLQSSDRNKALLTFWVLKEAAAKLSGEGLRGYPCFTNFDLSDPRVQEREGCLVAILSERNP